MSARLCAAPRCISSLQQTVQAHRGQRRLSIHCCCRFCSATCPDWDGRPFSTSPSSRRKRNSGGWLSPGGATLCDIFDEFRTTYVFRTKRRWSVPKIMQTSSGILKMGAVKRSDLSFWGHSVCEMAVSRSGMYEEECIRRELIHVKISGYCWKIARRRNKWLPAIMPDGHVSTFGILVKNRMNNV